jgi:hypothetical protein
MNINEVVEFLFEESTGLVDVANKRYGICPQFNNDSIKIIEEELGIDVEYFLDKATKLGLVVRKEKLDKNNKPYTLFYAIDPDYKKDNTEQLRRVMDAVNRFKAKDEPIK